MKTFQGLCTLCYVLFVLSLFLFRPPTFVQEGSSAATHPSDPAVASAGPSHREATLGTKEEWDVLSVENLGLEPRDPILIQKDGGATYTREYLRVQWRLNDPIDLYVFHPKDVAKTPAILYLYSYPADTDRFLNTDWGKRATADGFAAIGFVSALTGHRYHTRPMKEWFVSELQECLGTTVHDVQMILNYLASRGDIDMTRIGMFGQGSGAAIAVLAAKADPRIKALDLFNPWGDWPDWLKESPQVPENERPNYLKPEFLERVSKLEPVRYLPELQSRAVRVQQVLDDPITPTAAKKKIAAAAPTSVLQYENAEAHFKARRLDGLSGWLKSQLAAEHSENVSEESAKGEKKLQR